LDDDIGESQRGGDADNGKGEAVKGRGWVHDGDLMTSLIRHYGMIIGAPF
jgi:hypothetical protein